MTEEMVEKDPFFETGFKACKKLYTGLKKGKK